MSRGAPLTDCLQNLSVRGALLPPRRLPPACLLALVGLFTPLGAPACSAAEATAATPAEGVEEGRQALGSRRRYPWYDEQADGMRRVNVRVPWAPLDKNYSRPTGNLGRMDFSWMELFVWTAAILFFIVLAYLLIRAYLNREDGGAATAAGGSGAGVAADDTTRIEALPFRIRRGPLTLLEEARRHYELGDLRQAIIYLFSYELVEMDKQQIIRLAKGKTNRQYLREIRRSGQLRSLVHQTMVAFEDVFFGAHPLELVRFESCWRRLDEFEALITEPAT